MESDGAGLDSETRMAPVLMKITTDLRAQLSRQSGFDDTAIEKTLRSLHVVDAINQHEALQGEFILYGGTALPMFHGPTERLSADLDLIYCGGQDLASRERMHGALKSVLQSFGETQPPRLSLSGDNSLWVTLYTPQAAYRHAPADFMRVDANFQSEILLYPPQWLPSRALGSYRTQDVLTADPYDVSTGKLHALLNQCATRDLFDARLISQSPAGDNQRVRDAFMTAQKNQRQDFRNGRALGGLTVDKDDVRHNLLCAEHPEALEAYAETLLQDVRRYLNELCAPVRGQDERAPDD